MRNPVDPDDLVLRVDPGAEPAHGLAVDLNPALADQFLASAAGCPTPAAAENFSAAAPRPARR